MDKGFVIAYELTAETTTKDIREENYPMKFINLYEAKKRLSTYFPEGSKFQLTIIGTKATQIFTVST